MVPVRKSSLFGFLGLVLFSVVVMGCSEDDVKDIVAGQSDPVPEATANLVVTTAPEALLSMTIALLHGPGVQGFSLTPLIQDLNKDCGDGGTVSFPNIDNNGFTGAIINNCADENVVINGGADGTFGPMDGTCDLPTSMDATFNGTVDVDGQVLTFTNFGVNASSIVYNPLTCDLEGGMITAGLTGNIAGNLAGADLTINFGTGTLFINVSEIVDTNGIRGDGVGRKLTMTIDGSITVVTPCESGALTLATITDIVTVQPDVCPIQGQISITGAFGTASHTFDGSCDLVACTL